MNAESNRLEKYMAIDHELQRAKRIHPKYPKDMLEQLAIMQEEAGEVTKAVLHYVDGCGPIEDVKMELKQTAAMCMRMLENLKTDEKYVKEKMTDTYLPEQDMKDSD
jgi:NTP pyrophosphatase (non-canonical NTP hydrolase)